MIEGYWSREEVELRREIKLLSRYERGAEVREEDFDGLKNRVGGHVKIFLGDFPMRARLTPKGINYLTTIDPNRKFSLVEKLGNFLRMPLDFAGVSVN